MPSDPELFDDRREELVNAITHGVGLFAGLVGGVVIVGVALRQGEPWKVASAAVYSLSLVALYAASTVYHLTIHPNWKKRLRVMDHAAIYLLIAGTYTPFTLVALEGSWGWGMFGAIWGLAAVGMVCKLFWVSPIPWLSSAVYLAMGWLALVAVGPLVRTLTAPMLGWLVAGGLAYSLGVPFYHRERMRYSHAIWHGFVLAGSGCHYVAVAYLIAAVARN